MILLLLSFFFIDGLGLIDIFRRTCRFMMGLYPRQNGILRNKTKWVNAANFEGIEIDSRETRELVVDLRGWCV